MLRRFLCMFIALLPVAVASCAVRAESAPAAIDLAAMSLVGEDFAAVSWGDLAVGSEWRPTAADLADRAVWPTGAGDELDAVEAELLAVGWQQAYAASYTAQPDLDQTFPGRQAEIEIVAYADERGAEAGFALIPDTYPTGPTTATDGSRRIGDESRLFRVAARDPQAGTPNQELVLGFRSGRFTVRILLRDWSGEEPEVATIEELGARLLERIQDRTSADGRVPDPTFHSGRTSAQGTSANIPAVSY